MIDRYRRRDLTVGMRHNDIGLTVFARQANRRDRYMSRRALREAMHAIEDEVLDLVLDASFR